MTSDQHVPSALVQHSTCAGSRWVAAGSPAEIMSVPMRLCTASCPTFCFCFAFPADPLPFILYFHSHATKPSDVTTAVCSGAVGQPLLRQCKQHLQRLTPHALQPLQHRIAGHALPSAAAAAG